MGTDLEDTSQDPLDGVQKDKAGLVAGGTEKTVLSAAGLSEKVTSEKRTVRRMKQMDVLRRQKDRSYKNVFKGSVLVGTLMDHDENKFATRASAIKFAQKLLDAGHIESIVGSCVFEDSVHLYRWADETVVREAKKMVNTTSHIPRKKLIELVDMNQGDATDDAFDMRDVKDKLIAKFKAESQAPLTFATKEERRASRRERALRRRTLGAMQIGDAMDQLNEDPSLSDGGIQQTNKDASLVMSNNTTNLSRSASRSQEALDTNGFSSGEERTAVTRSANSVSSRVGSPSPSTLGPGASVHEGEGKGVESLAGRRGLQGLVIDTNSDVESISVASERGGSPSKTLLNSPQVQTSTGTPEFQASGGESAGAESDSNNNAGKTEIDSGDTRTLPSETIAGEKSAPELGENDISTCVYDGVEMKALDIENLDFDEIRPKQSDSLLAINKSIDNLLQQSNSYSDNEKQLLEQMKLMQIEHDKAIKLYENRISELLARLGDLRHLASKIDNRNGLSAGQQSDKMTSSTSSVSGGLDDSSISSESDLISPSTPLQPPAPAPPVPPPPPPPIGTILKSKSVQPSKPPIKPRLKMRPLFWNRIILAKKKEDILLKDKQELSFWHFAQETKFDTEAFERLFGKADDEKTSRAKSLHDAMSSGSGKGRLQEGGGLGPPQTAKILEENRSRTVAIKLRTMHCQMNDIRHAVYNMDFSKLDIESLYSLYRLKGTKFELDKISLHLQCHEDVVLDQPEQFLWELSQMSHFPERVECMMLQKRFNETLFNIDQQLSTVQTVCNDIRQNPGLRTIMETILALGNYMNGGTGRGQADGFEYTILAKIKDVRSMDNSTNLLQYIVRLYMKDQEDAGKDEAVFRLPDPAIISQAAQVSFADLDLDLNGLQHQLQTHTKKAQLVCLDTEPKLLQPFKDKMDDFFETAEVMVKDQQEKLAETQSKFQSLLRYMAIKDTTEQTTPESLFSIWAQFSESFKNYWKVEQKRIARIMFEKVEQKKRNRMRAARRRKSVDGKSNMKQRFAQLRQRSENVNPTVKMLRSQSLVENPHHPDSDPEVVPRGGQPEEDDGRRRRRRPQSDIYENESLSYNSDTSATSTTKSETMAERMQRRRRSRINSEEVQSNIQNARTQQEGVHTRARTRNPSAPSNAQEAQQLTQKHQQGVTKARLFGNNAMNTEPHGYSSDNDKIARRWRPPQQNIDDSTGNAGIANGREPEAHAVPRRRRPAVVSRDENVPLGDAPVDEGSLSARMRFRHKHSDSMTSLTDVAKYKPPGDRSPISPSNSVQHFSGVGYQQRSRYGQQYADVGGGGSGSGSQEAPHLSNRHARSASPCGSSVSVASSTDYAVDPGAPPRPALPAGYNFRSQGSSDTDIMDTDQEKINYREAIRKMSGNRRRSSDLSAKNPDLNRRNPDMPPMGRLR